MNDPDLREPEPVLMPSQMWQPWTLIVPAILLLPLLALAFSWQISPSDDSDLRHPSYHHPRDTQTPAPKPTAQPTPIAKLPSSNKFTMFVPDDNGKLDSKTFLTIGGAGKADFVGAGTNALKNLFPAAPEYFPPGTQLQSLSQDESDPSQVRVSLNEKFWNSEYWSGTSRTDAALQAIVHTIEAAYHQTGGSGPLHIQLLRDDQEMDVLGEYDMREPYTSDPAALAAKSSKMAPVTKP